MSEARSRAVFGIMEGQRTAASDAELGAYLDEQYRLYAERVFRRCLAMSGGDAQWAEDIMHDVFLRLTEKAATLDRTRPLGGWLLTVAHDLCLDRQRRQRSWWYRVRRVLTSTAELAVLDAPSLGAADDRLVARLRRSLDELPQKERAVVAMKYLEGERQTDIAATLGCSEGYVSKLLTRALARLRQSGWEVDDV